MAFVFEIFLWLSYLRPVRTRKYHSPSISSPIARALIGKEVGDSIEVNAPGGAKGYEILAVQWG